MVNILLFHEKCLEADLLIAEKFPWAQKNHTLHGLHGHSTKLMALSNGFTLGALSEEGLESTSRHIRRYFEILTEGAVVELEGSWFKPHEVLNQ